jgi:pilus assembly protein CpaB
VARRTLLLIASILTAALGTALIWLYVQGAEQRAEQNAVLVPALFLNKDVGAGQPLDGAVVAKQVPADVARTAITDLSQVRGQTLAQPAGSGQLLLRSMLSTGAGGGGRFPNGGAVALTINDPNRVPADLKPGDTVDVFGISAKDGVRPVVSNIKVRTIGPVASGGASAGTGAAGAGVNPASGLPVSIVGFEATDDQARAIYGILARNEQPALYLHAGSK